MIHENGFHIGRTTVFETDDPGDTAFTNDVKLDTAINAEELLVELMLHAVLNGLPTDHIVNASEGLAAVTEKLLDGKKQSLADNTE